MNKSTRSVPPTSVATADDEAESGRIEAAYERLCASRSAGRGSMPPRSTRTGWPSSSTSPGGDRLRAGGRRRHRAEYRVWRENWRHRLEGADHDYAMKRTVLAAHRVRVRVYPVGSLHRWQGAMEIGGEVVLINDVTSRTTRSMTRGSAWR
jgi:hypothetical protein